MSRRPVVGAGGPAEQRELISRLARDSVDEYLRSADRSAIVRAVAAYRLLVLTANTDETRIDALSGLSASRQLLFESRGVSGDIEDAIERGAAALESPGPTRSRSRHLANLGNAYRVRFEEVSSDLADLRAGLQHAWDALEEEAPPHVRAQRLSNFGLLLRLRFEAMGRRDDIDESVDVFEEALELADPAQGPLIQSNASTSRRLRGTRFVVIKDLLEAARLSGLASRSVAVPDHLRVGLLINAAQPSLDLFHLTGDFAHLEPAGRALRLALTLVDPESADRPIVLLNLASLERLLAIATSEPRRRPDEAVFLARAALEALPPHHPDRPRYLAAVGRALRARHAAGGGSDDARESVRYRALAADYDGGDPYERALSAYMAGRWATEDGDHPTALRYLLSALELLPTVVWIGLERATVLSHASDWQDLARDVAASAVQNDRSAVAVAALERGRTIYWNQVIGFPEDSMRLRSADRDLGERLDRIGEQLAAARAAAERKLGTTRDKPASK